MSTISRAKKNGRKKKKLRLDSKFWARILVIILTASMLASVIVYAVIFMVNDKVSAAEVAAPDDDYIVRVAIVYGSSVEVDFLTASDSGFLLGYDDASNKFHKLAETDAKTLNIACERNLAKSGDRYVLAASASKTSVGAFHIKLKLEGENRDGILSELKKRYPDINFFETYISGETYIYAGQFADADTANALLKEKREELDKQTSATETSATEESTSGDETEADTSGETEVYPETVSGEIGQESVTETGTVPDTEPEPSEPDPVAEAIYAAEVVSPSETALNVIDSATGKIIWRFDCPGGTSYLGVAAKQADGQPYSYIKGYKGTTKYTYDYVLECSVYKTDDYYGINVVNVLPLETYVCGVVPYEIGNNWPLETQKAFAIAVRSYAIALKGHHKSYHADICCSTDCQVYKGFGSTNSLVRQAVAETKGLIAVYKGQICKATYSSSTGGCTANAYEVWNGNKKTSSYMSTYGYLVSVATPWEKYEEHSGGTWTKTVTGDTLYSTLKSKGYTGLTGKVTSLKITKLGENNTFVQEMEFYDAKGNKVTVSGYKAVNSVIPGGNGNFVIGAAGSNITRTNYNMLGFGATNGEPTLGVDIKTNPYDVNLKSRQYLNILTADGVKSIVDSNDEYIMTANGMVQFNMSHMLDSQYYPTVVGLNGKMLPDISKLSPITETESVYCDGAKGSFVVIGRGYGHGVGLSQWGIYDLAKLGYDFETIIKAYYSGIKVMTYTDYLNGKR